MKININESSRLRKVRCTKIIYSYVGFLTVEVSISLTLLPAFEIVFFLLVYLIQPPYETFALSYYIWLCLLCLSSLGGLLFSEEEKEGSGSNEREK